MTDTNLTGMELAVIGMAGRFPAAPNLAAFWQNLKDGVETTVFYSEDELLALGHEPETVANPAFVKTGGSILEQREHFDAAFFGYTPTEAQVMDPQTRVFMETAWHTLEDAGYDPLEYDGLIGLYAGSACNFFWEASVMLGLTGKNLGGLSSWMLSNRDNMCTLTSYKLGLKGPSVFMRTTCSTSLVALHLACQSVLNGECHLALAGGITINFGNTPGYLYQEGMIQSSDGHCRAFDARSRGTVGGEGVGLVLVKRLEEALADRDVIHAIVKGTAINNDGARKIGYTAPSIDGQVGVIREALTVADVDPETIGYVETHGTGTTVGDPIEIEALRLAFDSPKRGYCWIGTVKTNIGHLDAAAGMAGLFKTVLALKHRQIPPSLFYTAPNPKIDFANTPFQVNPQLRDWPQTSFPRRAGISSFGIGGTNVHVIVQEAPPPLPAEPAPTECLLLLSARSQAGLSLMSQNLAAFLKASPAVNLADVAYTLQTGRHAFKYRGMALCEANNPDLILQTLTDSGTKKFHTQVLQQDQKDVIFMFPGLGGEYVNMGLELVRNHPLFGQTIDECAEIVKGLASLDIREVLYPAEGGAVPATSIHDPAIAPLVIFIFEYALAQQVMSWGIRPRAMIGYSLGEYVAACLAGVFTLEEALHIVYYRGQLLLQAPDGAMLSVPLDRETLAPYLSGANLSLAIDNGPSCIVSGSVEAVNTFETRMKMNRIICLRLGFASRALHSEMMAPLLEPFTRFLSGFTFKTPRIPYISNVTGQFVLESEVTRPEYWAAHLAGTVCFASGINHLIRFTDADTTDGNGVFLEVGPGYDLSVLVRHFSSESLPIPVFHLVDMSRGKIPATRFILNQLGRLWLAGVPVRWQNYYGEHPRQRISLPLYPFESLDFTLPANPLLFSKARPAQIGAPEKKADLADWFYLPVWKRSFVPVPLPAGSQAGAVWLLIGEGAGLAQDLTRYVEALGQRVFQVSAGPAFQRLQDSRFQLNPELADDYVSLLKLLKQEGFLPQQIVHFGGVGTQPQPDAGFANLIFLAQAFGKLGITRPVHITVVSDGLHRVVADEPLLPLKATVLGAVKVIPKEFFNLTCRSVDILVPQPQTQAWQRLINQLWAECLHQAPLDSVVAYRGDFRWVLTYEACGDIGRSTAAPAYKERGVYLITGGLGGMGLELARHLATTCSARLVLTRRTPFPPREQWESILAAAAPEEPIYQKMSILLEMERSGAELLICAGDVVDEQAMAAILEQTLQRFGTINGVIHAAGLPDGGMILLRTPQSMQHILAPKVQGTLLLQKLLTQNRIKPDFFLLYSSISSVLGSFGQVAYCAANAFLDAFAQYNTLENHVFTQSLNWDFWQEVGMGVETVKKLQKTENIKDADVLLKDGILTHEGLQVLDRVLAAPHTQVVISTLELGPRFLQEEYQGTGSMPGTAAQQEDAPPVTKLHPRPPLSTEYSEPHTPFEKDFAGILQRYFGFEQVGRHDNLFEYGITSLDMIHIVNTLKERLAVDVPVVVLFEYPTIHSLGQYLENQEQQDMANTPGQSPAKIVEDLDQVEDTLHQSLDLFEV